MKAPPWVNKWNNWLFYEKAPNEVFIYRKHHGKNHTGGVLIIDGLEKCRILEDEKRAKKVMGETRIPAGRYELKLRKHGGHHARYKKLYDKKMGKGWHKGMIEVMKVPNFKHILIHIGNTDKDTAGCPLVGYMMNMRLNFIGRSRDAYEDVYPVIRDMILSRKTFINIID